MSVRAYRVIKKEIADDCSFNVWHDGELLDFFMKEDGYYENVGESGGEIEVSVEALEKALKKFSFEKNDYRKKAIKADIAFAKKQGDEYVLYQCF